MLQITVVTGPSKPKLEGERLGGTIDFIEWLLCIISKANESIWEHCAAILMSHDAANLRSTCSFVPRERWCPSALHSGFLETFIWQRILSLETLWTTEKEAITAITAWL